MKRKPTYKEILGLGKRRKPYHELCREHGIHYKDGDSIAALQRSLIKELGLKEEDEESKISEVSSDAQIDLGFDISSAENENDQKKNFSEQDSESTEKAEPISLSVEKKGPLGYNLPVTIDELVQYWQRGFICHPFVLSSLINGSSGEHKKSDIAHFSQIDLKRPYTTDGSIILELDEKLIESSIIDQQWIAPITVLRSIKVGSEEDEEIVLRSLRNTNRGLRNEGIQILIDDDKPLFEPDEVDGTAIEINVRTLQEFQRITSLMGGFAMSSYIEKEELLQGEHFSRSISRFGSLFEGVFLDPQMKFDKKLLDFIIEKLKANSDLSSNQNSPYFDELLKALIDQDDDVIKERVLDQNRRRLNDAQQTEIHEALQENLVRKILEEIVQKGTRDPFLIFLALLNQYSNTKVPAASDKQSFLFAIQEFKKDDIIDQEEAIVVAFLLGYYLGYGKCWNPVQDTEPTEWAEGASHLHLLYEPEVLQALLENIIDITGLHYQFKGVLKPDKHPLEQEILSKNDSSRKIRISDNRIVLHDSCLEKFSRWKHLSDDISVLYLLLYGREHKHIEGKIRALFEAKDNKDKVLRMIEKDLMRGEFSDIERGILSKMIDLYQ